MKRTYRNTTALVAAVTGCALAAAGPVCAGTDLDEVWVGGWFSNNVIRVDWRTGAFLGTFVPAGSGGLVSAHDFDFGRDGDLYVASYGTSSILRYDGETGDFLDVFVPSGNGLIRAHTVFWNPADGTLLVSSELGHRVNQYDVEGAFLRFFVQPFEGGLNGPEFITRGPDGFLYLTAQSNHVLRLDPVAGGVVEAFVEDDPDTKEDETGGLNWGHGITFGPDGNMYVASSTNNRIIRYDGATGDLIDLFVSGAGAPAFPIGIAFGPDGALYVAAFGSSLLQKYDGATGAPLGTVANLGAMGLNGPLGLRFTTGPNCRPDLDDNGSVGVGDLLAILATWGPCPPPCPEDLDRNRLVNFADLLIVLGRWGPCD